MDMIIGADFYSKVVDGKFKQTEGDESDKEDDGFRPLASKFRWLLSASPISKDIVPS